MANPEESSPLLPQVTPQAYENGEESASAHSNDSRNETKTTRMAEKEGSEPLQAYGWTADGLPLGQGSVVGEPAGRSQWDSSIFACLGRNDEFCSSDLEVCLLGSAAPCMLYGSNVERLGSAPGTFANHCLPYTGLYLLGKSLFGWNCLAPWFSYPSRTAIRHRFNLEGSCEALSRCCGCPIEDEEQLSQIEPACDFATHVFCHPCALCQEGRELRRRLPHPGLNGRSVLVMVPPVEQTMGRIA